MIDLQTPTKMLAPRNTILLMVIMAMIRMNCLDQALDQVTEKVAGIQAITCRWICIWTVTTAMMFPQQQ